MTQKSHQRRGLGRGLGSLIPTAPRPEPAQPSDSVVAEPMPPTTSRIGGPGSADWIGVPLPGDEPDRADQVDRAGTSEGDSEGDRVNVELSADRGDAGGGSERGDTERGDSAAAPTEDALVDAPGVDQSVETPALAAVAGAYFAELPVSQIRPNSRQPREAFDEDEMAELVHSVQEVGLLQPIVVRPQQEGRYELIMGERRWRATQQAGLATIPAIVRETDDDAMLRDALLENLHRSQLNALEEAAAYQQLLDDFGCTHDELATRIGRSRPQISNTLRLLKLSPAVQRRVAAGVLSAGHARTLLAVEDAEVQNRLAGRVVAEGISVRGLEELVAVGDLATSTPLARRSRPTAPALDDLAARLSDRLETRVKVALGKRKGRISVEFASIPDLERIIGLIDPGHPSRTRQDTPESD